MQTRFKLIKKSLALFVAVALCLSALVMTASAADSVTGTATITIQESNVIIGGTINVSVTLESKTANTPIAAALFDFAAEGFEITNISVPKVDETEQENQYVNTKYSVDSNAFDNSNELKQNLSSAKFLLVSNKMDKNENVPDSMTANITLKMLTNVSEPEVVVNNISAASAGAAEDGVDLSGLTEVDVTVPNANEAINVGFDAAYQGNQGSLKDVALVVGFNYTVNGTADEKGIFFYATAPSGKPDPETDAKSTVGDGDRVSFTGFSLKNIGKEYTFIPYVKSGDTYYYGTSVTRSYLDYLKDKVSDETYGTQAKSILNAYYAAFNEAPYEGYTAELKTVESGEKYQLTSDYANSTGDNPENGFESKATIYGSMKSMALVLGFSGYPTNIEKTEKMVEVKGFNDPVQLDPDNGKLQLTGFPILRMLEKFEFTPYYGTETKTYGSTSNISYASYLIDKVNGSDTTIANQALTILHMLETITEKNIYESIQSAE